MSGRATRSPLRMVQASGSSIVVEDLEAGARLL